MLKLNPNIKKTSVLLLPFLMISCVKLISDEFQDFETVPALNCILVSGDSLNVHISLAEKLDSIELSLVDNANVQVIKDEDEIIPLDNKDNGYYTSDAIIEPGAKYRVSAVLDGYAELRASDSVPSYSNLSILSQTHTARLNEEGYYMSGISIEFTDNPDTEDYYELIIFKRREEYINPTYLFNDQCEILLNEGFESESTESLVFSDELIDETEEILDLMYGHSFHIRGTGSSARYQIFSEYTLIAELRHISREYYLFKKSQYFYENTRYADFIEGTAIAYPIYSNIENGFGIVASYSSSIDSIFVEADTVQISW